MTEAEKNRRMKVRNLVNRTRRTLKLIRKYQPKNIEEARALGIGQLQKIGEGAFREAYRIYGTILLIKFPLIESFHNRVEGNLVTYRTDDHDGKYHTRAEIRKIRVLSKFKSLRKAMPPVYYYNSRDGVMVTRYYPKATVKDWTYQIGPLLSDVIKELTGVTLEDLFGDNVRKKDDSLVITDLGY